MKSAEESWAVNPNFTFAILPEIRGIWISKKGSFTWADASVSMNAMTTKHAATLSERSRARMILRSESVRKYWLQVLRLVSSRPVCFGPHWKRCRKERTHAAPHKRGRFACSSSSTSSDSDSVCKGQLKQFFRLYRDHVCTPRASSKMKRFHHYKLFPALGGPPSAEDRRTDHDWQFSSQGVGPPKTCRTSV